MARVPDDHVVFSLFDRLTDEEPRLSRDPVRPQREQLERFKATVARDLAQLLNTRRSDADIPDAFEQTRESIAAYGVQDFTSAPMQPADIRRAVERCIRIFEPRLSRVHVSINEPGATRFEIRIAANLKVGWGQEPVIFDAELTRDLRRVRVSEAR